jgi:hypothetical protein
MKLYTHLTANNIKLQEMPFIRELSMEAYLIENEDVLSLDEENLSDVEIIDSELTIKFGRKSKDSDGRIDLLALYNQETLGIIELKLGELNQSHLEQLEDYFKSKSEVFEAHPEYKEIKDLKWIGVLVGDNITSDLERKISDGYLIEDSIPVAALTIKRYRGNDNNIYVVTNTYFKNLSRKFDRTQYLFNGKKYGKGRLVLAVLKHHLIVNEDYSYQKLEKDFPKELQGSQGVFAQLDNAMEIKDRTGHKRHFLAIDDLLEVENVKIAVSTEWGIKNIENFLKRCKELNYRIEMVAE